MTDDFNPFDWGQPKPGEIIDASDDRMVVAIVPRRDVAGVHAPGHIKKHANRTTYDWRQPQWSAENRNGIEALSEIGDLRTLLQNPHTIFAHLVTYIIVHAATGAIEDSCIRSASLWQPRINKTSNATGWLRSQGLDVWAVCVILDMDTPGHVPWTDELKAQAQVIINNSVLLLTCCWYWTTAGLRAVQPIFHIPIEYLEPLLREWLTALKKEGFWVDFSCVDWTRLMKMPKTLNPKTGQRVDFEPQNLDGMKKIDLEVLLDSIYGNPDPTDIRPRRERVAVVEVPKPKKPKKQKPAVGDEDENEEDNTGQDPNNTEAQTPTSAPALAPVMPADEDCDPDEDDPKDLLNGNINFDDPVPLIWKFRAKAIGMEILEVTKAGTLGPDGKHLSHHDLYRAIAGFLRYQDRRDEAKSQSAIRKPVKRRFVPGIVRLITGYAKEPADRVEKFVSNAREIIIRKKQGGFVPGVTKLRKLWPSVSAVLVQETIHPNESVGVASDGSGLFVEILSTDEAYAKLEAAVRTAPDGIFGIGACAGLGKTKLTIGLSVENMEKKPISINAETNTSRVPRGGKSGATFDKNLLAIQVREDVRAMGKPTDPKELRPDAKRLFGPASLYDDVTGGSVCMFPEQAADIAESGNSVFRELCQGGSKNPTDRCPFWDRPLVPGETDPSCKARLGFVGPKKGQFVISSHALMLAVAKEVGDFGRLTLDEPPALLESIPVTIKSLRTAMSNSSGYISDRYRNALAPLIFALETLLTSNLFITGDTAEFKEAVAIGVKAISMEPDLEEIAEKHIYIAETATKVITGSDLYESIMEYANSAVHPLSKHDGPPILRWKIPEMRAGTPHSRSVSRKVGRAGKILNTLRRAACSTFKTVVRIDYDKVHDERVLHIVIPKADYIEVLRRTGPTILTDANLDLHWDVMKAVIEPVIVEMIDDKPVVVDNGQVVKYKVKDAMVVHAFDGAEIRRVLLQDSRAIKAHWFYYGRPVWDAGITEAIRQIIKIAKEPIPGVTPTKRPLVLCLITFKIIRLAIEWSLGKPESMSDVAWTERKRRIEEEWLGMKSAHTELADLEEAKDELLPVLEEWQSDGVPGTFILGHYGGVRGMNSAKDVDCIATLGDPWPNLGAVATEATYLGVDIRTRAAKHIAAEEYQAQERLRSCRRTLSATAIHYGYVRPGGPMWVGSRVEVIRMNPIGRPKMKAAASSKWLVELMILHQISGVELSYALGKSETTISRMHSGARIISEQNKLLIEKAIAMLVSLRARHQNVAGGVTLPETPNPESKEGTSFEHPPPVSGS